MVLLCESESMLTLLAATMPSMRSAGTLFCLASGAAFGAMAVFGKLAFDEGASVGTLLSEFRRPAPRGVGEPRVPFQTSPSSARSSA